MLRNRRKRIVLLVSCLLCVLSIGALISVNGAYVNTNRDTRKAPKSYKSAVTLTDGYGLLYEAGDFKYYFREDRDILAVENTKTGDIWKTGVDKNTKKATERLKESYIDLDMAKQALAEAKTDEEKDAAQANITTLELDIQEALEKYGLNDEQVQEVIDAGYEIDMTETFLNMYNSLVSIQYFKVASESVDDNAKISSSNAANPSLRADSLEEGQGASTLEKVSNNKFVLHVTMNLGTDKDKKKLPLNFNVYMTFSDKGDVTYEVPYEEFDGDGKDFVEYLYLTPFLGASGGKQAHFDETTGDWDKAEYAELTPGYAFIPDGSGALIRYEIYNSRFNEYVGDVYGQDPSESATYYEKIQGAVPLESPVMPVFGACYGDGTQTAFVAYAESGDEYMQIIAAPGSSVKNAIKYTYVYPKFKYNTNYFYVLNQRGDTFSTVRDKMNKYDIKITYSFLYGDGSDGTPKADYTGMARRYRQHLIDEGILTEIEQTATSIPTRIDFLMSDSKKGVIGTTQVTMTTTEDIDNIISELSSLGVSNLNGGVVGWQSGGENIADPDSTKFSRSIGSKGEFEDLFDKYKEQGIDLSFSRDFSTINETMMGYYKNAAKHNNTQYLEVYKAGLLPSNVPVSEFSYALPDRAAEWMLDLFDDLGEYSPSFTVTGISNTLVSSHNSDGSETTVTDAIKIYQDALEKIKSSEYAPKINLKTPNKYLWKYADRYLLSPVTTSQYVYETDTVPFLQMVLHGTMEVYGPYSNFSFYTLNDRLKMVDYNISPSFVITKKSSYLLASTVSSEYYSTEYSQYKDLIAEIYSTVNEPLSQVIGYEWVGRYVLADGVVENVYTKGSEKKAIIINYTDTSYSYAGKTIAAQSAVCTDYQDVTIPTEDNSGDIQLSTDDLEDVADVDAEVSEETQEEGGTE